MEESTIFVFTEFCIGDTPYSLYCSEEDLVDVSKEHWGAFDEALTLMKDDIPNFLELTWRGQADLFWEGLDQAEAELGRSLRRPPPEKEIFAALRHARVKTEAHALALKITASPTMKRRC